MISGLPLVPPANGGKRVLAMELNGVAKSSVISQASYWRCRAQRKTSVTRPILSGGESSGRPRLGRDSEDEPTGNLDMVKESG